MLTIATFSKPEEAHLFRTRLEAAGIRAYIQDEHLVQMDWFYSNAIGGVRVQIDEDDLEEAKEFLAADAPVAVEEDSLACPFCGSYETGENEKARRLSFLTVLLFNLPLPVSRRKRACRSCGRTFRL